MVSYSIFVFYHRWHEIHLQGAFSLELEYGFFSLGSSCSLSQSVLNLVSLPSHVVALKLFFLCVFCSLPLLSSPHLILLDKKF